MGRAPCCDKGKVKKGPWSPEEDAKLKEFIEMHGTGGNWIALPHKAGLKRCGKSCRLRWLNYLRPNIKHGEFTAEEDRIICSLFAKIGSRWSIIAAQLPGRTDNDVKNYWNTKLKKKLLGISSTSHRKTQVPPPPPPQLHQQSLPSSNFDASFAPPPTSTAPAESCYTPQTKPLFSDVESVLPLNAGIILGSPAAAGSLFQTPPLHYYNQMPMKSRGGGGDFLQFGGDQQSCGSSDGSCSLIGYGREMVDYDLSLESLLLSPGGRVDDDVHEKMFFFGGAPTEKASNGVWGEAPAVDYAYEDIKHLITSPVTTACCNSLFFGTDVVPAIFSSPLQGSDGRRCT